jgi:hypothetical protein
VRQTHKSAWIFKIDIQDCLRHENDQKSQLAQQNLHLLPATVYVAQKVGKGVGRGEILL